MIGRLLLALLCASLSTSAAGFEAKAGWVVVDNLCGSRVVVETPLGYTILQWYGGPVPYEGQQLFGDFERYGMVTLMNVTARREGRFWVEDYWLSRQQLARSIARLCPD